MPSTLVDNLGPCFVMVGYYGDASSWQLVGRPEHYDNPMDPDAVYDYRFIDVLDGLVQSARIVTNTKDPAVPQSASGSNYGYAIKYSANISIDIETTVAAAGSLAALSAGWTTLTRNHAGSTIDLAHPRGYPSANLAPHSVNDGGRILGLGIKPIRTSRDFIDITNGNEDHDVSDLWFGHVYPSSGTTITLEKKAGEDAQSNFTFTMKTLRRSVDATGQNFLQPEWFVGGQLNLADVREFYGDVPSWTDLIPQHYF